MPNDFWSVFAPRTVHVVDVPQAPEVARRLADALEAAEIPYAIGGAIAYGLYGPPRATNDVDVNVFVPAEQIDTVLDALGEIAAFDRQAARRSAIDRGDLIVRVDGMRVDIFVPSISLSEEAGTRIRTGVLGGRPISILSAEDLALFKLLFFRSKDLADVDRLVNFAGGELDRHYIRRWLLELVGEDDERVRAWDSMIREAAPPD